MAQAGRGVCMPVRMFILLWWGPLTPSFLFEPQATSAWNIQLLVLRRLTILLNCTDREARSAVFNHVF